MSKLNKFYGGIKKEHKESKDIIEKFTLSENGPRIPKKFTVFSKTFTIVFDPKMNSQRQLSSFTEFHRDLITLASSTDSFERSMPDIYINWLQEVIKIFLMYCQEHEMIENQQFLTLFSNALYQAIVTSVYAEHEEVDRYTFKKIPRSFQVFGKTFSINEDAKILYDKEAVGFAEYHKDTVILHRDNEAFQRSIADEYHTFLHELNHIILNSIGEFEKNENESFVNLLAAVLAQTFSTAEY